MRLLIILIISLLMNTAVAQQHSVRFFGNGYGDIDRIKIPLDNPHKPVDVSLDFTIDFWMKAQPGQNNASFCDGTQWYFSNIMIDRDVDGPGDYGDYGIGLGNRKIMFGIEKLSLGPVGLCGSSIVDDGVWHHIAVVRKASNGNIKLFIDGVIEDEVTSSSATGDISYRNNRPTSQPNSDPFLVFGAEKHDYPGSLYFSGWLDEVRISDTLRYSTNFIPPTAPYSADIRTVALYHLNEGSGTTIYDVLNVSNGFMNVGGSPAGPEWSNDSPFICSNTVSNTNDTGPGSLRNAILCAVPGETIIFTPSMAGQTIHLNSGIAIDRNIQLSNLNSATISIVANNTIVFETDANVAAHFTNLTIVTTHSNLPACKNYGNLQLTDTTIKRTSNTGQVVFLNYGTIQCHGTVNIQPH
ncbi:MAG: LamG domain-containing protein [Saprospiraceae bacterium]|nr:LamG domain-containing protein [Saprospiraceae bacterium]